jgi:hypothetical protein
MSTITNHTMRRPSQSAPSLLTATRNARLIASRRTLTEQAPMNKPKPTETPPLSRAGRRAADATLAAAHFRPTADGRRVVRHYEVHGMDVVEWQAAEGKPAS